MLYGTLVCVSGDNLGSHSVGGFKGRCNTFTPQIKGICCGLNVMYHIPQLSRCVTTSLVCYNFHWNVLQLPIGMHIIMLQLPMACCKNTRAL